MTSLDLTIKVHEDEQGAFWSEVPDLPGCFASGENLDELREALREAIWLYLLEEEHGGRSADGSAADQTRMEIGELRVRFRGPVPAPTAS
jgi:predicted RNase H-like HicB family nuclease